MPVDSAVGDVESRLLDRFFFLVLLLEVVLHQFGVAAAVADDAGLVV